MVTLGIMTFGLPTFIIMTLSIMTLCAKTLITISKRKYSIMAFILNKNSITTFSIMT
jgi:hypothetical protein